MQILGPLLVLLLEAQNGCGSRNREHLQKVMISKADGTFSKNGTVYEDSEYAAPKKADSQDVEHVRNKDFNKSAAKQQSVMKLELDSGKVKVVMMDLSIHEHTESIIVWESGVEKWDQSKSETAADEENGVSRQALDYAWAKSIPPAHSFIVASDKVPVKKEVQDVFYDDHAFSTVNIVFTGTAEGVELFNKDLAGERPATVMLSLDKKSFGRAAAYPNIAFVTFAMVISFTFPKYR